MIGRVARKVAKGIASLALAGAVMAAVPAGAATLATGPELGAYFPVGHALRMLLESTGLMPAGGLTVVATQGSVENLKGLRDKRFDLAIVQADQAWDAYNGRNAFSEAGPDRDLRQVMLLHEEALALVVRRDSGIKKLEDLRGKRVDPGPKGSGGRPLVERLLAPLGWPAEVKPVEPPPGRAANMLCGGQVDGVFVFIGHPSAQLISLMNRCETMLVPIRGKLVKVLDQAVPPIDITAIPAQVYSGVRKAVPTVGVRAVLVARADVPDVTVTDILKAVAQDRSLFRNLHPALFGLGEGSLKPDSGFVPLHPAAAAFFDQR